MRKSLLRPEFAKFPVNFPVSREFGAETSSQLTASSATSPFAVVHGRPPTAHRALKRRNKSTAGSQNKPPPSGLVSRVPAAEIEALVVAALRSHLSASSGGGAVSGQDPATP